MERGPGGEVFPPTLYFPRHSQPNCQVRGNGWGRGRVAVMRTDTGYAAELDRADPLARFKGRFYVQPGTLYFDGNSLGLLSRDAEAATLRVLEEWKTLGIGGWLD